MGIQFGIAIRQFGQELQYVIFIHATVLQEAEGNISMFDVPLAQGFARAGGQAVINDCVRNLVEQMAAGHPPAASEAIARKSKMANAECFGIFHQDVEDDGVQMQVQMAVYVIERQARGMKFFKLSVDFGSELIAQAALEEVGHADADRAVGKFGAWIDEAGNFTRREGGMALQEG